MRDDNTDIEVLELTEDEKRFHRSEGMSEEDIAKLRRYKPRGPAFVDVKRERGVH